VAYELWVHYGKEPASVAADSRPLTKLQNRTAYENAPEGWYYGPGCFYGSETTSTLNIKIPKHPKSHLIRITK
jgi:hypothetical protein